MAASDDLLNQMKQGTQSSSLLGIPATTAAPSASDALLDGVAQQQKRRSATVLDMVAPVNPDKAAEASRLATRFRIDTSAVEQSQDDYSRLAKVQDAQKILDTSPILRRQMLDAEFAKLAHDDVEKLSEIEAQMNPRMGAGKIDGPAFQRMPQITAGRGPDAGVSSVLGGLSQSIPQAGRAIRAGLKMQFDDLFGIDRSKGDYRGYTPMQDFAQVQLERSTTAPEFESSTARGIYGGVDSTLRMIPGLAASVATRSTAPMMATMGVQTEAEAYAKYRTRGASAGDALIGGLGEGAVEVATEAIPMGFLVGRLGRVGAGEFIAGLLAREIPSEQIATLAQDAIDTAIANPDKTWAEYAAERPDAAYQTLVSTVTQSAIMGGANQIARNLDSQARRTAEAEQAAEGTQQFFKSVTESKLHKRAPDSLANAIQKMAEESGSPEVYIDAQSFAQALQQSGMPALDRMPKVAEQLEDAVLSGGDIAIPMGELSTLAGTPLADAITPFVRRQVDALSKAEADQLGEGGDQLRAQAEQVLMQAETQAANEASANAVRDQVLGQLTQAGRFTPDVNTAYADFVKDFYVTQAQRLGTTPDALLQEFPLNIVAESPAEAGLVLNQEDDYIDLFHGSPERMFEIQDKGLFGGVFASQNADSARSHGNNLLRARVKRSDVMTQSDMEEAADDDLRSVARWIGDADLERLRELVIEDDQATDDDARIMKTDDAGAASWEAQRLRGAIAREKGFKAVEMNDEHGTSYLVLPGTVMSLDDGVLNQATNAAESDRPRGTFDPGTNTIALLKDANLTTFLHETGHFYLEVLADLASRPNAPAQIQVDMSALLGWMGFEGDVAAWRAQALEQRREGHEKFARGFEAYLFEGNAPNPELRTLFQRFRSWLKQVYQSLSALNVELTDEVRGVMGRMLATDDQIREAEAIAAYMPMFDTAEAAGMTQDEFIAYQRQADGATADAQETLEKRSLRDMKWLENAKSRELKKLQKQAADQRKAVKAEVTEEVEAMPAARARAALRGKKPSDLELEAIAEELGFSSVDHMQQEVTAAPSKRDMIRNLTDQRMLERYGDLPTMEAMERAALEAVHNEARAKFVAAEMKALDDMGNVRETVGADRRGRSLSVNVLTRAAKQFAAESIARKRIRDIRIGQYTVAEGKAGRQAMETLKKGDTQAAAIAKRNQLLNHYGAKTAAEALAEVDKGRAYLTKFNGASKTIDPEYLDQIHQLLEKYDLRRGQSLRAIDKRKSLAEWVESQRAQDIEPLIDETLMAEANRVHYRDLSLDGFRGLVDAIRNIEHLGRLKKKLMLAKDQREFKAVEAEIETLIRDNAKSIKLVELEGHKGVKAWLDGFWAGHRKMSSLARQMSGGKDGGPLWEAFIRPMNEQATFEAVENEKATMALAELYKPMLALKGGLNGDKRFFPSINASLSRGGRLAIALNQGNETNRRRVMEGDGWNAYQVQDILNTLTREEWQFVQNTWDFIDSYWPQIAEKEKRVTGIAPEKVEAEPLTVSLAGGGTMTLRGGYYPIKYDADRSTRAEQHEGAELAKDMMRGAFTRATTRRGHTKTRTETVNRPIRKDLGVVTEHVAQVVHDLAWHEWLIDANRLLGSNKISEAIRETQGVEVLRTMKDAVKAIATADIVPQTRIDQALLKLRANVSRSTMGLSLTTALLQPFGLTQSIVRIGPRHVLRGAARWAGDATRFENSMEWIGEKSDFMRLRSKTFNRELNEIKGRVTKGQSETRQIIDASLFMLMQKMQMVADVPTWIGQYEKSLAEGMDDATAVAMADQAVLDAQGGGQTKDLSEFQRKHPMLTMFYSYFNTTFNLVAESTGKTDFKNPAAVAGWLSDMALLLVVPAVLPNLVIALAQGFDSDEPEDWAKKMLEWQASFLLAPVVGIREASGLIQGFDYAGPPAGRVLADLGKAGTQITQGEVDEPAVLSVVRLFGTAFGIPTTQAVRSYRGWTAWEEDDAPATSILFGPPPKD